MINTQNKKGKTHSGTVHGHKTRKVKHVEKMHATRIKKRRKKERKKLNYFHCADTS